MPPGTRARTPCSTDGTVEGCGRNCSTDIRADTSGQYTGSPGTCNRSCRSSTPRAAAALRRKTASILEETAFVENGLANWPPEPRAALENARGEIRVQWCHGAPGIVVAAAPYLDEELVRAGAELTWRAGAHRDAKGAGICHGTAGNGYALLAAFERTGDERWLERARRFAVHALAQVRRQRADRGCGRYSLWTGDLGVALYLASCIDARAAYPVLDAHLDSRP